MGCGGGVSQTQVASAPPTDADELLSPFPVTFSVRPQALAHDEVYGKFVSAALRAAAGNADDPNARRFLDVLASCDRAQVGVTTDRRGIAVLEGARADWDPSTLDSGNGWQRNEENAFEYRRIDHPDVCLFVPKPRLWIVGIGEDACGRIHSRFMRSSAWNLAASFEGPLFEASATGVLFRRNALQREFPGASKTTLALLPGKAGLRLRVAFDTEEHARNAEANVKSLILALAAKGAHANDAMDPKSLERYGITHEWLSDLQVASEGTSVTLAAELPQGFAERFTRVK